MMKAASGISFFCAFAAYGIAPTSSWVEAGQRALIVFTALFLWSTFFLFLLSRILPAGVSLFTPSGPKPEGTGEDKYVDLEKQSIDRTKLQDLLR